MLDIDPAANVARAAEEPGRPTLVKFFAVETARELVEIDMKPASFSATMPFSNREPSSPLSRVSTVILNASRSCTFEFSHPPMSRPFAQVEGGRRIPPNAAFRNLLGADREITEHCQAQLTRQRRTY